MGRATIITRIKKVEFVNGRFDRWLVKVTHPTFPEFPTDSWYFAELKALAESFGTDRVYADFLSVYARTTKDVSQDVLMHIHEMCEEYPRDAEVLFTIFYYTMIAEENKENTQIGKLIKAVGVNQLLIQGYSPEEAATNMIGKPAGYIRDLAVEAGLLASPRRQHLANLKREA